MLLIDDGWVVGLLLGVVVVAGGNWSLVVGVVGGGLVGVAGWCGWGGCWL